MKPEIKIKNAKIVLNDIASGRVYQYEDDTTSACLSDLNVDAKERKKGFGTEVLKMLECIGTAWGAQKLFLWADKRAWMHEWYKRKDYEDFAPYEDDENFVWMIKSIKK